MIMMTMMARKYHIGRISHQDKTVADKNHCEYFDFANDILDMILMTMTGKTSPVSIIYGKKTSQINAALTN